MFNFFKKKNKGLEVVAVVDGDIMPINQKTATFMLLLMGLLQHFSQLSTPLVLRLKRD